MICSIGSSAAAAGVSVQTFYAHYPGKDELLMAMPDRAVVDALLAVARAAATDPDRPLSRLTG